MVILKAIGAFFAKIWRWIKETAWIQPLLIVGAIFALIFSIPYITEWAQSFSGEGNGQFYRNYDVSLEGEKQDIGVAVSDADKLMIALQNADAIAYDESANSGKTTADYKKIFDDAGAGDYFGTEKDNTYGKFFLTFYKDSCTACNNAESGLKYLKENWNSSAYSLTISDSKAFNMYAINASYVSNNDGDYTSVGSPSAFNRFCITNSGFFEEAGDALYNAPYRLNASIAEDSYLKFALNNTESSTTALADFPVPSILLVDFTQKAIDQNRAGASEVLFTVSGDTNVARAKLLANMWNHTDSYSQDNLFTKKN